MEASHEKEAERGQQSVTAMFNTIAPRYDDFTRLFSFGMDARWKKYILDRIALSEISRGLVLDLACGTGDLAFALAQLPARNTVVGLDVAANMIVLARQRALAAAAGDSQNIPLFVLADIMQLPLRDERVTLTTAGYAFRNVPDFRLALRQLAAMMQPGALLVTLDFYIPRSRIWRALFLSYLRLSGGLVGWLWHRSPAVYEYISHSVRKFVTAEQFARELEAAGFAVEDERRWLYGGIAAHFARRAGVATRQDRPSASA